MVREFHLYLWLLGCFQNKEIIFCVRYLVWTVSVEITKYHFAFEFWEAFKSTSVCAYVWVFLRRACCDLCSFYRA